MVGVVQLVERQVVILNVAGSSPVTHPTGQRVYLGPLTFFIPQGLVRLACYEAAVTFRGCRQRRGVRAPY
jgi:hypothetical protein